MTHAFFSPGEKSLCAHGHLHALHLCSVSALISACSLAGLKQPLPLQQGDSDARQDSQQKETPRLVQLVQHSVVIQPAKVEMISKFRNKNNLFTG